MRLMCFSFLLLLIFLFPSIVKSDTLSFVLESSGEVPTVFHQKIATNIEAIRPYYQEYNKQVNLEEFLKKNAISQLNRYESGKILYGHLVSNYIKNVGKIILKSNPELNSHYFSFFVYKNPTVNAFSTYNGEIFINIGLLAQAKNEAEIAYIICHEIAHFTNRHLIKSHQNLSSYKKKKNILKKIDHSLEFSRENELKADSIGLIYFKKTSYKISNVKESFLTLLHSDKYYLNLPLSFEDVFPQLQIPSSYQLAKINEVEKDQFYYDKYHTHPNIGDRIANINNDIILDKKDFVNQDFLVSKSTFTRMQFLVKKEQIRLLFLSGNYIDAIYLSHLIRFSYKDTTFFDEIIERSLYSIARYKNKKLYSKIATPYRMIVGERQSLHFSFKQLTRKQVSSLALKYFYDKYIKSNKNKYLSYITTLISDMKNLNQLNFDDFHTFTTDSINRVLYSGKLEGLNNRQIVDMQVKQKEFYKYVFINELEDSLFQHLIHKKQGYQKKDLEHVYILPLLEDYSYSKDLLEETICEKFNSIITRLDNDQLKLFNNNFKDLNSSKRYNDYCSKMEWVYQLIDNVGVLRPLHLNPPLIDGFNSSCVQVHYSYYNYLSKKTHYEILTISIDSGEIIHAQSFSKKNKLLRESDLLNYLTIDMLLPKNQKL